MSTAPDLQHGSSALEGAVEGPEPRRRSRSRGVRVTEEAGEMDYSDGRSQEERDSDGKS